MNEEIDRLCEVIARLEHKQGNLNIKLEDKIAELVSKFKESEKNTDDWTIKVDKKYKELEQKIDDTVQLENYIVDIDKIYKRIEKLELAIKNSPPNSHLQSRIKELEQKIGDYNKTHMIKYEQWCDKLTDWVERIEKLESQIGISAIDRGCLSGAISELQNYINNLLDGEKDVEVSDLSADLKIPHSTEPYMGNGKGNSTSLQPKDSLTKFRDKVLEKFDEKPSRCEKCGSSLVMDIATLNKGDPFCPKCFPNKKQPSEPFELIEKFIPPRNIKCKDCMANPIPELIAEFLPHLDWALNELYNTHYDNDEYKDALKYYEEIEKRDEK